MLQQSFVIDKYNIISDDEYYYFFISLNNNNIQDDIPSNFIIKVKKEDLVNQKVLGSLYMLKQINDKLNEYINTYDLGEMKIYYLKRIDSCVTEEQLSIVLNELEKVKLIENVTIKENKDFSSLSKKQNLEKNKLIIKINLLNIRIMPTMTNQKLMIKLRTILSSLESIHFIEMHSNEIMNCSKQLINISNLLSQLNGSKVKQLESLLINYLNNPKDINKLKAEVKNLVECDNIEINSIDESEKGEEIKKKILTTETIERLSLYPNYSKLYRIDQLFEFAKTNGRIVNFTSKDKKGQQLRVWLSSNKKYVIELAKDNIKAMYIALRTIGKKGPWISEEEAKKYYPEDTMIEGFPLYPKDLKENRVEEIFEFVINHDEKIPTQNSSSKQAKKYGNWLYYNKTYIIELAKHNIKAMYIALRAGRHFRPWISDEEALKYYPQDTIIEGKNLYPVRKKLSTEKEKRIEEIFEFIINNDGKIPTQISSNETERKHGIWLSHNKTYVIELAKDNIKAMYIALRAGVNFGPWVSEEEALKYYPKDTIIEGKNLYIIVNKRKEEKIDEIFEFIINYDGRIPLQNSSDENEKKLGVWLHNNKNYIIKVAKHNVKAMYIALRISKGKVSWISEEEALKYYPQDTIIEGKNLYIIRNKIKEEKIDEIFEFIINYGEKIPSLTSSDENEKKFGRWLHNNKTYIIKLAKHNIKAMYIALRIGRGKVTWISEEEALKYYPQDTIIEGKNLYPVRNKINKITKINKRKEEKIDEIFEFSVTNGKIASSNSKDNVERKLGVWLKRNKQYIISQSSSNPKAMYIALRAGIVKCSWISMKEAKKYYPSDYLVDGYPLYPSVKYRNSNNKKEASSSTISFQNINVELSKQVTEDGYKLTSTDELTTKSKTKKKK